MKDTDKQTGWQDNLTEKECERLHDYFRLYHGNTFYNLDDLEISDTPGYWRFKKLCDPKTCGCPIHGFLFNEDGIKHTVTYFDDFEDPVNRRGQFESNTKLWRKARYGFYGSMNKVPKKGVSVSSPLTDPETGKVVK